MAKKKLLSESVVRRFMGLAGMKADIVSNALQEMYSMKRDEEEEEKVEEAMYAEEEPAADEEMPPAAEEPEMDAAPADEPAMDAAGEEAGGEVELSPEVVTKAREALEALLEPLESQVGDEKAMDEPMDEPEMDAPAGEEADEVAPEEEDQEVMESLSGINLQLSEDEIVQEVARRVSARLLRAKKAQAQLDEALGRKTSSQKSEK
jgi:ubiquinol-cytochrome c reductase cytochrome c1 subunit